MVSKLTQMTRGTLSFALKDSPDLEVQPCSSLSCTFFSPLSVDSTRLTNVFRVEVISRNTETTSPLSFETGASCAGTGALENRLLGVTSLLEVVYGDIRFRDSCFFAYKRTLCYELHKTTLMHNKLQFKLLPLHPMPRVCNTSI